MKRRIAIFASVSSKQQASIEKDSLPSQVRDGHAWAESVDGEVVAIYKVPGHSRNYILFSEAERHIPAYHSLRNDCTDRRFDVLWCRERSRLGRTDALIAAVEGLCSNAGATVYSAAMPSAIDGGSRTTEIYLSAIERAGAEHENVVKTQRHRMGMRARARRGLPSGVWPLGYRVVRNEVGKSVGGEFTPEIEVIKMIACLYLDGLSYRAICEALDASPWKPCRTRRWAETTVRSLIHNDLYAGYVRYGEMLTESDRFPQLWDEKTHKAIIRERKRRHPGGKAPASRLSGSVICQTCGYRMSVQRHGTARVKWFWCPRRYTRYPLGQDHTNRVRESDALQAMLETLTVATDPDSVTDLLAGRMPNIEQITRERDGARRQAESVKSRMARLLILGSDMGTPRDVLDRAHAELVTELEAATHRLSAAQDALLSLPSLDEQREALTELVGNPRVILEMPLERARALLQQAGLRVYVEDNQIVAVWFGVV